MTCHLMAIVYLTSNVLCNWQNWYFSHKLLNAFISIFHTSYMRGMHETVYGAKLMLAVDRPVVSKGIVEFYFLYFYRHFWNMSTSVFNLLI